MKKLTPCTKWETACGKNLFRLVKLVAKLENKAIEKVSMADVVQLIMESGQNPVLYLSSDYEEKNNTKETIESLKKEKAKLEEQLNPIPTVYFKPGIDYSMFQFIISA